MRCHRWRGEGERGTLRLLPCGRLVDHDEWRLHLDHDSRRWNGGWLVAEKWDYLGQLEQLLLGLGLQWLLIIMVILVGLGLEVGGLCCLGLRLLLV